MENCGMFFRSHCILKVDCISVINKQKLRLNLLFPFSVSGNISLQGHMGSSSALDYAKLGSSVHSIKWLNGAFHTILTKSWYEIIQLLRLQATLRTSVFCSTTVWPEWMNQFVSPLKDSGSCWTITTPSCCRIGFSVVVARNNLFITWCLSSCGVQLIWPLGSLHCS